MKTLIAGIIAVLCCITFVYAQHPEGQQEIQLQARPAQADAGTQTNGQPTSGSGQQAITASRIGYRMTGWKTIHGDGSPQQAETISALQRIGCEVTRNDHAGHVDISYRCPSWRSFPVENDEQAREWHNWLVEQAFETVFLNPTESFQLPTVRARLPEWKTMHMASPEQAQSAQATFELIGCETILDSHGDHIDLRIRSANWNTIGLPNAQAAHVWQQWLDAQGFETFHDHSSDGTHVPAGHSHSTGGGEQQHNHSHEGGGHNHSHEGGGSP